MRQRLARASQLTRAGNSPSVTDCTSRARMCFASLRRVSTRNSCRSFSSAGTIRALEVRRQPQYLGQCRRSRTFSSSIARTASLPVGDTRKGSCARMPPFRRRTESLREESPPWCRRSCEARRSQGPRSSVSLRSTFSRSPSPTRPPSRFAEPLNDPRRRGPAAAVMRCCSP